MKRYRIKKGDTLESIAKQLELTYDELRDFHNRHCELYNLLGDKIHFSLKEILYQAKEDRIPHDFSETFLNLTLKTDLRNRTYGIQVSSFEDGEEINLKYIVHIQWLQRGLVRVHREKLFINEEEPNMMADKLAAELSAVLYPIGFIVNSAGELTGIYNQPEIKKRWNATKQKLKEYYVGDIEERYMTLSEETLSDADLLFSKLKKDWFLQAFFNGLYGGYKLKKREKSKRSFPIISSIKGVEYTMETQLETLDEDGQQLIKLEFRGEVSDERTLDNFENEMNFAFQGFDEETTTPAKGKYRAVYFLDTTNYLMSSLYLECTLELEKTKKVYVTASELNEADKM